MDKCWVKISGDRAGRRAYCHDANSLVENSRNPNFRRDVIYDIHRRYILQVETMQRMITLIAGRDERVSR